MSKNVAVVGSSGGNLYNLGGKDPFSLLGEIKHQLDAAGIELRAVQFIAAKVSMDNAKPHTPASLIILEDGQFKVADEGKLEEINSIAKHYDRSLAEQITNGEIDALILVSADPKGTNIETIKAAASKDLPGVGTGGTSCGIARSMGLNIVSASGTTGTTNRTRAVAYVSGLARHWKLKYTPAIGDYKEKVDTDEKPWQRINLRGIMGSSLPAFIAMAITLSLSRIPSLAFFESAFEVLINSLPIVVSVIAAKQVSGLDETGIIAGVVAGVLSAKGGILGGIVGGIFAGMLATYLLNLCFKNNFPATTANIVAGGLSGLFSGFILFYGFAPLMLKAGDSIRWFIEGAVNINPVMAGAIAGALQYPAVIAGIYHAAFLPIILIEMEKYGYSFLGAIDMMTVMVSAGITLANAVSPRTKGEAAVAIPGFAINIGFGTFTEAAYPFMFADKLVFAGALVAETIAGGIIGLTGARGTGYVPMFIAPFVSNKPMGFFLGMMAAGGLSFIFTFLANQRAKRLDKTKSMAS